MCKSTVVIVALSFCILPAMLTLAESAADSALSEDVAAVRIEITDTKVMGRYLEIEYRIINDSEHDAWILTNTGLMSRGEEYLKSAVNAELFKGADGKSLTIRRRLIFNVPLDWLLRSYGRYTRLRPKQSQTEWICFGLPRRPRPQVGSVEKPDQATGHVVPLAIEFGYYLGNPSETWFRMYREEYEAALREITDYSGAGCCTEVFLGAIGNNRWCEWLTSRDEEFMAPTRWREDERVLRAVMDNLSIPYAEESGESKERSSADLSSYARVEIRFEPSTLEYFFPFDFQQSLLTPEELEQLNSQKPFIVKDALKTKGIDHGTWGALAVGKLLAHEQGPVIRSRSKLDVICLSNDKSKRSFSIFLHRDRLLDSEDLASLLPMPISRIRALDFRIQCATNLKNHWYRFRLHGQAAHLEDPSVVESFIAYPPSSEWCDAMLRPFNLFLPPHRSRKRVVVWYYGDDDWHFGDGKMHLCPSGAGGKGHYAMNPNCTPDSASDMVLLFETKAGWNQHGGPELFTFDNHDPKGGCVLLNDGTVKFIRTAEELRQLRWK